MALHKIHKQEKFIIVLEYAEYGDLRNYLKTNFSGKKDQFFL